MLANYTLAIAAPSAASTAAGRLMGGALELRMEHFLVVSISVIVVLLILVIAVTLLLVHVCRRRIQQKEAERRQSRTAKDLLQTRTGTIGGGGGAPTSCHMPKNIQMGTSKLPGTYMGSKAGSGTYMGSQAGAGGLAQFVVMPPDLLTEAALVTPDSSCVSMETVSTPCHSSSSYHHSSSHHTSSSTPSTSDHSDISSIMKDYGNLDRGQPIIGQYRTAEDRGTRGSSGHEEESAARAGRHRRLQQQQPGRLFSLLASQDTYPTAVPPPPPTDDPEPLPPWTSNNPYIHTSRPYRLPLVKPVGPDEQYPKSPSSVRPHQQQHHHPGLHHQDYAAMASLTESLSDPLYESITSLRYPPGCGGGRAQPPAASEPPMLPHSREHGGPLERSGGGSLSSDGPLANSLRVHGDAFRNDLSTSAAVQQSSPVSTSDCGGRTEPVIRSSDSVQDILRKLSGDYAVRADSPDISRELEYAFLAQTEETNI